MNTPHNEQIGMRQWLIEQIAAEAKHVANEAAEKFGVSRQTVNRELQAMVTEGVATQTGRTRARQYSLALIKLFTKSFEVKPDLREDSIWRQDVAPLLADLPANVLHICQFGLTEMLNNVIDHSGSKTATIVVSRNAAQIMMVVADKGVGIFKKVQEACRLDDPRDAIFELTKGKFTTAPDFHTGEGVFFTSRMFDLFVVTSQKLALACGTGGDDVLFNVNSGGDQPGTMVAMTISVFSERTMKSVMDKFASGDEDYGFTKTRIPLSLAKYGAEQLVSRSQAKRVVAGLNRFKDVYLDFSGIETIGQAFADEIFRVFRRDNPTVNLKPTNLNPEIQAMINRVQLAQAEPVELLLPGVDPKMLEAEQEKKTEHAPHQLGDVYGNQSGALL
jgi:anti-sigma regulatory factor (Ser/Thr protein kinase)